MLKESKRGKQHGKHGIIKKNIMDRAFSGFLLFLSPNSAEVKNLGPLFFSLEKKKSIKSCCFCSATEQERYL